MLTHLSIKNFTVVKALEIEFSHGLTAVTGETGAGKSISLDAINLCLGARADAKIVRTGAERADLIATFNISNSVNATKWLKENDLDNDIECIIRRTISADGRSRAWINGTPVTAQQLKSLGQLLVNIHGQHAHQQLLKNEVQLALLDSYGQYEKLLIEVADSCKKVKSLREELSQIKELQQQSESKLQLLQYQVTELDEFAIAESEFKSLEIEYKKSAHNQELLHESSTCLNALQQSDFAIQDQLQSYQQRIEKLINIDPNLKPINDMLLEASISIGEAGNELQQYIDGMEFDADQSQLVEQRYNTAIELSRKHRVNPETLFEHHQTLIKELKAISSYQANVDELERQVAAATSEYHAACSKLSNIRLKTAEKLASELQSQIRKLNMPHAEFSIAVKAIESKPVEATKLSVKGQDNVEFLLSSNPGQPQQPLHKIASGGELSRIGLAMQVIATDASTAPTLIFDEVDSGISGSTASVVGKMLRELGKSYQVMCVTHLAQVAACAEQQMFVTKLTDGKTTETQMIALDQTDRVQELARLLGGDSVTKSAIANAKDLLAG